MTMENNIKEPLQEMTGNDFGLEDLGTPPTEKEFQETLHALKKAESQKNK